MLTGSLLDTDVLVALVLATGALGTAAFGVVEGLKWLRVVGEAGYPIVPRMLGPIMETLTTAYGKDADHVLRAQYRGSQEDLARAVRQGARVGLTAANAERVAAGLTAIDAQKLKEAAAKLESGEELPADLRNTLGRFELAVDARIDAALTLARSRYVTSMKLCASVVAILIAVVVGALLGGNLSRAVLIGVAAVPLAPIANDVASGIRAAALALRSRQ